MEWTPQRTSSADAACLPDSAEIVANLWYLMDHQGFIYSLRIMLYVCEGSDDEKLTYLTSRAYRDYLVAHHFPVPKRFSARFVESDGTETAYAVIHHDTAVTLGGLDQLFFDGLDYLQKQLPAQTELGIPESPLIKVTALIVDDNGRVVPVDSVR